MRFRDLPTWFQLAFAILMLIGLIGFTVQIIFELLG
jgi:uncharacterized membrane protein YhdT